MIIFPYLHKNTYKVSQIGNTGVPQTGITAVVEVL